MEEVAGKPYGEWIKTTRRIALRPGTPLIQREGIWKVTSRYEVWHALGQHLFDDHLNRFKDASVKVLRERDPQFDLPPDERYAASIHGKTLKYSDQLRKGLAETLALLGSYPRALTSCSYEKAEYTAILAVREILAKADWVLWASLNGVLPLLAEAAPGEYLDAIEQALDKNPSPFDAVFNQEGNGIFGRNYMTGLLWSLETLAWDPAYLTRVIVILGELASKDPGGNWGNRPSNSLSTILLPWFPQTCASVPKRKTAVATLMKELPDKGWKLLLSLLPQTHGFSSGSSKPAWREIIPQDWSEEVTYSEIGDQEEFYAGLAVEAANKDFSKLTALIDRIDDLTKPARDKLLAHLNSDSVLTMSEEDRLPFWTKLIDFVSKHRKYADAKWAMKPDIVEKIAEIAEKLTPDSPVYQHQRLFSERDIELFEEEGNYDEQRQKLEKQRQKAIGEILAGDDINIILEFAKMVESPGRVGFSLGVMPTSPSDSLILPECLESDEKPLNQLAGGYIWGRFKTYEWPWVDKLLMEDWTPSTKGQFLTFLPFVTETWDRVSVLLAEDESPYWSKTNANPYDEKEKLEFAVDRLLQHGRANEAIGCLNRMHHDKQIINTQQAVRSLDAVLDPSIDPKTINAHSIIEVIKELQDSKDTNPDDLFRIEWNFLPLLDRHRGVFPKFLERRLAQEPSFFCEVIELIYRPEGQELSAEEPSEHEKKVASNGYRLISNWETPPGVQEDGTFNGEVLFNWLGDVKKRCRDSGLLGVALSKIGHVLKYAPRDPDGLWLSQPVASTLNAKDHEDMRNGFRTEILNSRGVHSWTAGREEQQLASKYRSDAEAVEEYGYHRLAKSLRDLADSYNMDAERQATRDPFDE